MGEGAKCGEVYSPAMYEVPFGARRRARARRRMICSPATCGVLFGARRRARARRRTICSPARCSARVGVGEGAGARDLQSGVVAIYSSARVGVGEGAEACSYINSGRPGALLRSSVAFGSGCGYALPGVPRKAPLCSYRLTSHHI